MEKRSIKRKKTAVVRAGQNTSADRSEACLCLYHTAGDYFKSPAVCLMLRSLWTNLSICKYGGVVSFKAAFDQSLGTVLVDAFLLGVDVKDVVVGEGLVLAQHHLGLTRHHKGADVAALDLLFGQLRTDPAGHRRRGGGRSNPKL